MAKRRRTTKVVTQVILNGCDRPTFKSLVEMLIDDDQVISIQPLPNNEWMISVDPLVPEKGYWKYFRPFVRELY